jgi:hypothetical protein
MHFELSPRASRFSRRPLRVPVRPGYVPSCGFTPLQGLLSATLAIAIGHPATLLGLPCRSAHTFRGSRLILKVPPLRFRVRVQGFSPSSRLPPPRGLVGLFRPTNALRLRPSGISPLGEVSQLIADPKPPCSYLSHPLTGRHARPANRSSCCQCVATHAYFAVCLSRESVPTRTDVIHAGRSCPSWVFPSPGCVLRDDAAVRHCRSSRALRGRHSLRSTEPVRPGVSLAPKVSNPSQGPIPS